MLILTLTPTLIVTLDHLLDPEVVHFPSRLFSGSTVLFLNFGNQLVSAAFDFTPVIIGELAPLGLHISLPILEMSLNSLEVHQQTSGLNFRGPLELLHLPCTLLDVLNDRC